MGASPNAQSWGSGSCSPTTGSKLILRSSRRLKLPVREAQVGRKRPSEARAGKGGDPVSTTVVGLRLLPRVEARLVIGLLVRRRDHFLGRQLPRAILVVHMVLRVDDPAAHRGGLVHVSGGGLAQDDAAVLRRAAELLPPPHVLRDGGRSRDGGRGRRLKVCLARRHG
ncbi:hypothetical protein T492DRAFT_1073829 [Pavlovales sp. CCMP2436]|nr:hypothetical protein T492DRAFT_1073829 [Pavlovales sp. CCMP2436]